MPLKRPRIVVASFYPMFTPPSSGGEQRLLYLYSELAQAFDIDVVSMTFEQSVPETIEHGLGLIEYRVPKPAGNDAEIWRLIQEGIGLECSGYVAGTLGSPVTHFGRTLSDRCRTAAMVIHETPYTLTSDEWGIASAPRVYMSQNNEARLVAQMLKGPAGERAIDEVRGWERRLVRESALVFATCEEERQSLAEDYGVDPSALRLAPNGFRPADVSTPHPLARRSAGILFMGSQHPPNVEALHAIVEEIAPLMPGTRFDVIGSVCGSLDRAVPDNVVLHGLVSTEEKSRLLANCALAINPMISGAGTNLKMLDYLGAGAPVVTTPVGARGLELVDGIHARVVALENMPQVIAECLGDEAHARAMGARGRALAFDRYTWHAIAMFVLAELKLVLSTRKHRLLSICDYSIADPSGGGQVRVRALLESLAERWDVHFLCLHDGDEIERERLAPGLEEIRIPKCRDHRHDDQSTMVGEWISIGDVVAGRWCTKNPAFVEEFLRLLGDAHMLAFEHCFLADMLDLVPSSVPVVYFSHNVEADLKRVIARPRRDWVAVCDEVEAWERRLLKRSELVVCVSGDDRAVFRRWSPATRYRVIENGVSIPTAYVRSAGPAFSGMLAVFVGSAHPPNVEAAAFIVERIAPLCPEIGFAIVGNVCDAVRNRDVPPNVLLLGRLDAPEKAALFDLADFAVNPMQSGGGSSLKVPDFWSHGLPLLSTAVGVRGFDCVNGRDVVLCESAEDFASALSALSSDVPRAIGIGNAARRHAGTLSWPALAARLDADLLRLLKPRGGRKSLLVATYRFGHPLRGGAEIYLDAVLRHLILSGEWDVTVASTACSTIDNALGFSAHYAPPAPGDALPDWLDANRAHLFPVDSMPDDLLRRCASLSTAWLSRSRRLAERLVDDLAPYELGGGWNYPEVTSAGVARWMGCRGQIVLPVPGTLRVTIEGGEPRALSLQSAAGASIPGRGDPSRPGLVEFDLADGDTGLCSLVSDALVDAPGDPRELTVRVVGIEFLARTGERHVVVLADDAISRFARQGTERWIAALVAETAGRVDLAGFVDVRGPRSTDMQQWLRREAVNFDVVLVQGVPFSTVPDVVRVCRDSGMPVVALPHVHIEDPFYHWPELYRTLADADSVIASPSLVTPLLLEPIGAQGQSFPGGGVDPEEFGDVHRARVVAAFRRVHGRRKPFILVLGRKAGAKRYDRVIAAHQRLLGSGLDIDLVLIGNDEDKAAICGRQVYYLGAQPRDVILGALRCASCLATMSESESFGIVIVEAWMSGTPVVANAGCLAFQQLVESERTGLLVESDSDLMSALRRILDDKAFAARLAAGGAVAAQPYTWSSIAQELGNLLDSFVKRTTCLPPAD